MKSVRRGTALSSRGRVIRPITTSPLDATPSHEAMARRADLKWQARGCPSGTALQDRLEAEAGPKTELGQGRRG